MARLSAFILLACLTLFTLRPWAPSIACAPSAHAGSAACACGESCPCCSPNSQPALACCAESAEPATPTCHCSAPSAPWDPPLTTLIAVAWVPAAAIEQQPLPSAEWLSPIASPTSSRPHTIAPDGVRVQALLSIWRT